MKERFEGEGGKKRLIASLQSQKCVAGDRSLAEELADNVEVIELSVGTALIKEGESDNDVYFLISGNLDIVIKGKKVATRSPNDHVGEMAAIEPAMPRSASVVCSSICVVAKINESKLSEIADKYPAMWRNFAKELVARLSQRSSLISRSNDQPRIFIMCASETLSIAREVQSQLSHDYLVTVWTNGVFLASNYPLEDLERAVEESDFGVAIATADDVTESRGVASSVPRDNVIFELGWFMGRLGRQRTILLQPRGDGVKLPSDMKGITPVTYRTGDSKDLPSLLAPACSEIGNQVKRLGVRD